MRTTVRRAPVAPIWDLDEDEIQALRQAIAPLLATFGADAHDPELRLELDTSGASVCASELVFDPDAAVGTLFDEPPTLALVSTPDTVPAAWLDEAVEVISAARELLRRTVWGATEGQVATSGLNVVLGRLTETLGRIERFRAEASR